MVQAIENRELKVQDLANKYNVSDRTIQIKIKELGLVWVATESKYTLMV
jgi:DeoR/GlpR family transcriptional regulator of sugar metabolism